MTVKTSILSAVKTSVPFVFQAFFGALFDGDRVFTTNITSPVRARYVLFNPREPLDPDDNNLCLRVDIATCQNGNYTFSISLYQDKNERKPHTVFMSFALTRLS